MTKNKVLLNAKLCDKLSRQVSYIFGHAFNKEMNVMFTQIIYARNNETKSTFVFYCHLVNHTAITSSIHYIIVLYRIDFMSYK